VKVRPALAAAAGGSGDRVGSHEMNLAENIEDFVMLHHGNGPHGAQATTELGNHS